jgi:hypothetical protein
MSPPSLHSALIFADLNDTTSNRPHVPAGYTSLHLFDHCLSRVRAFFSPVSQLGACFSRHLLVDIQTPTLRPHFLIRLASATIFVRHLLFVKLTSKHITLLLSRLLQHIYRTNSPLHQITPPSLSIATKRYLQSNNITLFLANISRHCFHVYSSTHTARARASVQSAFQSVHCKRSPTV